MDFDFFWGIKFDLRIYENIVTDIFYSLFLIQFW
jgi:hypothetical protein